MTSPSSPVTGRVYLVGAGPGDPDLLTVKALRLLQTADVVVHDRLIGPGVLALIPAATERLYAGKRRSHHQLRQPALNEVLVERARAGQTVVRLKGGDPFVFGRGGEELEALLAANVPFEIVPGVTAALGAAAYAGIPLTHRDHAHAVVLATGYGRDGPQSHDWAALARAGQTLCLYMGATGLDRLSGELIAAGLAPTTPACAVENASLPQQRVVRGSLRTLPERARDLDGRSPVLVIVGAVVALIDRYAWFASSGASTAAPFAASDETTAVSRRTA